MALHRVRVLNDKGAWETDMIGPQWQCVERARFLTPRVPAVMVERERDRLRVWL